MFWDNDSETKVLSVVLANSLGMILFALAIVTQIVMLRELAHLRLCH